ncbi:hypothetical protein GCM10009096_16300 [Parasphingorhabdus litoris]|uniref:non-specific protein-tyrosine kinase n=1 Tax=Parasphingorhabdus litoris TaxID=394733 RepID=A0ABN1AFS7_9SPHN|nr:polysaccharide biosynthesis tyrosine autokinase [Parasphingorhabdus litoris]
MNLVSDNQAQNPGTQNTGYYEDTTHGTPPLLQYWHAILRHKIAIATIVAVTLMIGVLFTLLTTPYYTATSRIEINRTQDKVTNVEGLQQEDTGQNLEFYQTQYALLESRSLAERVARAQNLATRDSFFEAFGIDPEGGGLLTTKANPNSAAERNRRLKLATDILIEHISISPVRGSSLVDISFESPSIKLSADIANSWVTEFVASNLDRRFDSSADARKFLEERLEQLRQKLEDSERQLVFYADRKQIVTLSSTTGADGRTVGGQTLATANLESLNAELAQATAQRIAAESEAKQSSGNKDSLSYLAINGIRQQRATIAAEYAKLLVQFEPEYPEAKALESQIAALDSAIAQEEARIRSGNQASYREAVAREKQLSEKVNQLKNLFSGERRASIQYGIYQREVDTNRQLYEGLLQRFKEIGVAGVGSNNISIVDRARLPDKPSSPLLVLNLLLATFVGLIFAGLYVFVFEQIDQTVKDQSDVRPNLGIAGLGSIPDLEKDDILESLKDKKSLAWEAYLSISTSLSFLTDHGVPRSFLMTSTRPNEGKSTSAISLATVLASTGRKVLLVDADMRNPSLHVLLQEKNNAGLSTYLSGQNELGDLIQVSDEYKFHVMKAGPIPPNAAELLSSDRVAKLVARLNDEFDHIIIDAPPVLGLADIPLLANTVEGVVYTIEANGPKLKAIEAALERVHTSHAKIFGAIITKVAKQHSGYGYSYEYSYGGNASEQS